TMDWKILQDEKEIDGIIRQSELRPQVIYKHSTRCSISSVVRSRLEKLTASGNVDFYYLDLIRNRNISDKIAMVFKVRHESPQILLIKNGECVYDESHMSITAQRILENIER